MVGFASRASCSRSSRASCSRSLCVILKGCDSNRNPGKGAILIAQRCDSNRDAGLDPLRFESHSVGRGLQQWDIDNDTGMYTEIVSGPIYSGANSAIPLAQLETRV